MEQRDSTDDLSTTNGVEALLDRRVRTIIDQFNKRDITTPFNEHASHDFVYETTWPDGKIVPFSTAAMIDFLDYNIVEGNPHSMAEILSSDVTVDLKKGTAEVWVTMLMHNDNEGYERERVVIYTWRRAAAKDQRSEAGAGAEAEAEEWVWCKGHSSASRVPSMPHYT